MIKKNILMLFYFGCTWAVGLQALNIPSNAYTLSLTGTGIAGGGDLQMNPAYIISENSYIGFSNNNWLGELSGQQASAHIHKWMDFIFTIESLNIDDLELWGEIPGDEPSGTFGVHWVSTTVTTGWNIGNTGKLGVRFQSSLARLYTESQTANTLNIGYEDILTNNLHWGVVIKNVGWLSNSELRSHLPVKSGIGLSLNIPSVKSQLMSDFILDEIHGNMVKVAAKTNWKYINFLVGKSVSDAYNDIACGFSLHFAEWSFHYGILFHENDILGLPQYFEIRWHY